MPSPLHYWGRGIALWGCEKVAPVEFSPKVEQASQALATAREAKNMSPAQSAWLRFVDEVERGEQVDQSGQYVAKGTQGATDASGHRLVRPKFDAATAGFARRYAFGPDKTGSSATGGGGTNIVYCDECVGSSGGGPRVTSTFISSEGLAPYSGTDNPNGYIWDLKIGHGSAQGDHYGIPNSYNVLYSDLNKGAGGPFIYIGFSRIPRDVSESPESINNGPYAVGAVTYLGITKKYSYYDDYAAFLPPIYYVWVDTGRRLGFELYDLNEGVSGTYIRAIQSKSPNAGLPLEIGVLSGNSSNIQPPVGWSKASIDLNEGAGGDFIYFCVKAH